MFTLPELPYAYNALEPYIDEETMHIHHDKHHGAYVKNINDALANNPELLSLDITTLVQSLEKVPEELRTKVRNNAGGHANHTLFWTLMTNSKMHPSERLLKALNESFGSFEDWKKQFSASAMGRFGSGWAWLVVDQKNLKIIDTPNQDSPLMQGQTPILGIDVWEHAYYLKYQNRRLDYIEAFFNVINWEQVEKEYTNAL